MTYSEITLREAIEYVDSFCPAKIIFNGIILYNDYDSEIEIAKGVLGEIHPPLDVIPDRIWQFDKYIVTSLNIEIIDYHHSVVSMQGKYITSED